MSYLRTIKNLSAADNLGGILSIYVARKADILSMPEVINGVITGDITFHPGAGWILWQATFESKRMRGDSRSSQEGPFRNNVLTFLVPKDDSLIRDMLERAEEDEFIVLFQYPGADKKIFGLLDMPVNFSFDHDSGNELQEGNRYTCRFFYEGPENSYFYNGDLSAPAPGSAPALVRYNGTVIASLQPGETLNIISDFGFTDFYTTAP
jgi:hypothetical protein